MKYPVWFQRAANVHKFDGDFEGKICSRHPECNEFHSEVAEILINAADWSCSAAETYVSSKIKIAIANGGMPNDMDSMLWPWNRCKLFRKHEESDQDYYYRLKEVIKDSEYRKVFVKTLPPEPAPETAIRIVGIEQGTEAAFAALSSGNKKARFCGPSG